MATTDLNTAGVAVNEQFQRGDPGGRGGQAVTEFFNEDGSVDQEAVDVFLERFNQGGGPAGADPTQFLERFNLQIDTAFENGEITEAQATELKAALSVVDSAEEI